MANDLIGDTLNLFNDANHQQTTADEAEILESAGEESLEALRGNRNPKRFDSAVDTGGDDSEVSDNDAAEGLSTAIIDETDVLLDTTEGREVLADGIDGQTEDTRSEQEAVAVGETLNQLDSEDALEITVEIVEADAGPELVVTEDGGVANVDLQEGEDSAVVIDSQGNRVLVLDDDLSLEEVVDETEDALVEVIGEVAEQNGVEVDYVALRSTIRQVTKQAVSEFFETNLVPIYSASSLVDVIEQNLIDPEVVLTGFDDPRLDYRPFSSGRDSL